ncbi:hypothetical protein ScPMuIL_005602 [Solemya velum]
MATDSLPAFSAFEKQLRTLCLHEFPCGAGPWRDKSVSKLSSLKNKDRIESQFAITLQDYNAEFEKTETLQEYVTSKLSPWHIDYSWSEEAKQLREIAVKSPWVIDDNFILNHFHTLRIIDKNVTEVDPNLLKFQNLDELTLSVNYIASVNSRNLPRSLKVLELCANQISDLSELCVQPPLLIHLGLGHNKISFVGDYITGDYWPNLLSIDLGHNNLGDLLDTVRKIGSLPKLRNLVLQGNPLSLIPGYRGYTVDSLRKLNILDDVMISADERHRYKGLARRREYILDEAKFCLEVSYVKGIPVPEEIKNPDDQPEFPIVERKYFVQFMFLEDASSKAEVFQITHEDLGDFSSEMPTEDQSVDSPLPHSPVNAIEPSIASQTETSTVKNVLFTAKPEVMPTTQEIKGEATDVTVDKPIVSPIPPFQEKYEKEMEEPPHVKLSAVMTDPQIWMEELELNWSKVIVRDDLLALRDFLMQGMEFSVVEEVVLAYPADELSVDAPSPTGSKKGAEKGAKGDKKPPEKKDDKAKGGKDKDKKKKKGEPEQDLKRMPPTYNTLASWHIPMGDFLEGDHDHQSVYTHGAVEIESTIKSTDTELKKDGKKDGKPKKPGSAKKKEQEKVTPQKGDKKDKAKPKTQATEEEREDSSPPPPLEVQVGIHLLHWKTATDSLKQEEETKSDPAGE